MISLALEFEKHATNSFFQVKWLQLFILYPSLNQQIRDAWMIFVLDVCIRLVGYLCDDQLDIGGK